MSRARALVVCPGRGSYGQAQLGSLASDLGEAVAKVDCCDAWRADHDRPTVRELDGATSFRATRHVAGEHASLLTFAVSLVDAARIDRSRFEIVGVTGNSMGWYTALAVTGALPMAHAVELVDTMGAYQADNVVGGQVMIPVVRDDWSPDPELRRGIDAAIDQVREEGHVVELSIDLGSFWVLGADGPGVKRLLEALPSVARGSRTFPTQLPMHSAFHTSLMRDTSTIAKAELSHLAFQGPGVPLVDGRGQIFRPQSSDPEALREYTLGHQVVAPYDFTTALRAAMRHCAPDVIIALGPGNSLGGPIAYGIVSEGWNGIRERRELSQREVLRSFGIDEQRRLLVA